MANSDKTMDVSKPGKVAADASSKPIIVTHRPMVQDPMMKPETEVSDLESQKESPKENNSNPTSGEKVIQPIDKELKADSSDIDKAAAAAIAPKPKAKSESQAEAAPDEVAEAPEAPAEAAPKEAAKDTPKEETTKKPSEDATPPIDEAKKPAATSESAEVDAMVDQAASGKHKEKQEAEEKAAKAVHLQKLIDDKKYFVKTGQVARRRNNRIALAFLVLIVLVIGLYLAVDAGAIKPGFDVPVHVINT